MDVHKALTRGTVDKSHGRQLFTIDRAHKALPLVRRVVEDIVKYYRVLLDVQREYQNAIGLGPSDVLEEIRDRRQQIMNRLNDFAEELQSIGCEIKDYELGLVDFPSVMGGREVYLCWKLGEDAIGFWHEVYTGYASRQPLPQI